MLEPIMAPIRGRPPTLRMAILRLALLHPELWPMTTRELSTYVGVPIHRLRPIITDMKEKEFIVVVGAVKWAELPNPETTLAVTDQGLEHIKALDSSTEDPENGSQG